MRHAESRIYDRVVATGQTLHRAVLWGVVHDHDGKPSPVQAADQRKRLF
jgi:hypothetical protein